MTPNWKLVKFFNLPPPIIYLLLFFFFFFFFSNEFYLQENYFFFLFKILIPRQFEFFSSCHSTFEWQIVNRSGFPISPPPSPLFFFFSFFFFLFSFHFLICFNFFCTCQGQISPQASPSSANILEEEDVDEFFTMTTRNSGSTMKSKPKPKPIQPAAVKPLIGQSKSRKVETQPKLKTKQSAISSMVFSSLYGTPCYDSHYFFSFSLLFLMYRIGRVLIITCTRCAGLRINRRISKTGRRPSWCG